MYKTKPLVSLCALSVMVALSAQAADQPSGSGDQEETIITLGTRVNNRTATESSAPIDIITNAAIESAGVTDVGELLRTLVPSFNMNNTTTSDGQDLMRPATLRGLGPDQVLVLVNGKRRHQQAIVAVQQNVGRGSAGTDMNAIPVTAIDHVEVLRDGAAAQYGSDAIGGVINIILKHDTSTKAWASYGETSKGDGENKQIGVDTGFNVGDDGFVNIALEWQDKGEINRAGKSDWGGAIAQKKQLLLVGEAAVKAKQLFVNSRFGAGGGELYAFAGFGKREGDSLGFFRYPTSNRVWDQLYPEGVTPELGTQSEDTAVTVGYRHDINDDWKFDTSYTNGKNRFEFRNLQSLNVSYGPTSPTSAYDGALSFKQRTFNVDVVGDIDWGIGKDKLSVALGAEHRSDGYQIEAGDVVSYARGDVECDQRINPSGDPDATCDGAFLTTPGMQGFQGYQPQHEVDTDRTSNSFYVDTEGYFTDSWSVDLAVRFEDYSDFGNATTGKLATRLQLSPNTALRGAIATGFRAPGVQQEYFTQRSISLDANGNLADLVTLRPGSDLAKELGFEDLKQETSDSISLGFIYTGDVWTTTLDAYQITIDNRIIYSQGIGRTGIANNEIDKFFDRHGNGPGGDGKLDGVARVEIFTNAADTKTKGIDWVNAWRFNLSGGVKYNLEASYHWSKTEVTSAHTTSSIVSPDTILDAGARNLIEEAQPATRAVLAATRSSGGWSATARATYYGEYSDYPVQYGLGKHTFGAKTIFDLTTGYSFNSHWRMNAGILNLFDTYPDKWGSDGTPFSDVLGFTYGWNTVPFGLAGRQYKVGLEATF